MRKEQKPTHGSNCTKSTEARRRMLWVLGENKLTRQVEECRTRRIAEHGQGGVTVWDVQKIYKCDM